MRESWSSVVRRSATGGIRQRARAGGILRAWAIGASAFGSGARPLRLRLLEPESVARPGREGLGGFSNVREPDSNGLQTRLRLGTLRLTSFVFNPLRTFKRTGGRGKGGYSHLVVRSHQKGRGRQSQLTEGSSRGFSVSIGYHRLSHFGNSLCFQQLTRLR